jgi:cell wall-associated NlpC family hydrolase
VSFTHAFSHPRSHRPAAIAATAALCAGALVGAAAQAQAAPSVASPAALTAATGASRGGAGPVVKTLTSATAVSGSTTDSVAGALALSAAVANTAASLAGRPYRWGATGPSAFDCSGYTKYVYARWGISVPRTAQQQYLASRKISKSEIRPGDMVFFVSRGYTYHVAIYAGNGQIWHSPHSGSSVRKVTIWTSAWVAGRFI